MKNPNGFGCIKHLSGSRRNPWEFVVTEGGKQKVKSYFPSKPLRFKSIGINRMTGTAFLKSHFLNCT